MVYLSEACFSAQGSTVSMRFTATAQAFVLDEELFVSDYSKMHIWFFSVPIIKG